MPEQDVNSAALGSHLRLSIVMPVRNDGVNVQTTVRVVNAILQTPCEILVVHDTPDDDAVASVSELQKTFSNVRRVHNTRGRGVVNAVSAGTEAARAEYVMILTADDIGPVLIIDKMVRLMDTGCQFLSVTRYSKGGKCFGGSHIARFLSRLANWTFQILSTSALSDCTVGLKMYRRDIFPLFCLSQRHAGWSFALEMSIKAQLMGLKFGEVPVVSLNRIFDQGESTFNAVSWVKTYLRWYFYGVRRLHLLRWPRPKPMVLENIEV